MIANAQEVAIRLYTKGSNLDHDVIAKYDFDKCDWRQTPKVRLKGKSKTFGKIQFVWEESLREINIYLYNKREIMAAALLGVAFFGYYIQQAIEERSGF